MIGATRRTMMACTCAFASMVASGGSAQQDGATSSASSTIVDRGITGEITFTYAGRALEARRQQDLAAPMLLRLERSSGDGTSYTARFIGAIEGEYDLAELMQHRDGRPPEDLAPVVVRVVSNLPAGSGTDLFDAADLTVDVRGGYRRGMLAMVAAWLAIPALVIAYRLTRPKRVEVAPAAPAAPTLADQLRPLVEAAAMRELSTAEQGRLELLLYHFWRERLAPQIRDVADGIRVIRADTAAGELFAAIENWLHRPDPDAHDPDRLEELLAPYRSARPIDERELAGAGAVAVGAS